MIRRLSLACGLLAAIAGPALAQPDIPEKYLTNGFAAGCQAYTFNRFTAFEAIEKTAKAGGKVIEFFPGQKLSQADPDKVVSHDSSDDVVELLKAHLNEYGLKAVNYGVVGVPNDEAGARKVFDFAKKLGLRAITTESVESIDVLEKLAKEYDIAVAFHNHPRQANNPNYKVWDPNYIKEVTEGRDKRVGSCADTGHWVRSGLDPVECLKILEGRIISSHLKDLHEKGMEGHDVPFGTGVSNIKGILDELKSQGFKGNISIEYEYNWDNSVPEVTECINFIKKYGK